MTVAVPRDQVVRRLREAGFSFKRRARHVELYRRGTERVPLPLRNSIPERLARTILHQAGIAPPDIERFLK